MRTRPIMAMALATILAGSLAMPAQARPERRDQREWVGQRNDRNERQERDDRGQRGRTEQRDQRGDRGQQRSGRRDSDKGSYKDSQKGVLSRDEAARRAQRQYGGRVLSVDLLQSEDAPARYRIKLLSNGNVRTVDVNALED